MEDLSNDPASEQIFEIMAKASGDLQDASEDLRIRAEKEGEPDLYDDLQDRREIQVQVDLHRVLQSESKDADRTLVIPAAT